MVVRTAARAGEFYDADPEELRETLEACFLGPYGPGRLPIPAPFRSGDIVAIISPHAGLRYSGYAAASGFAELADDGVPDTVILIGPNHFGLGAPAAVMAYGKWETPLGMVEIDNEMAGKILQHSRYLQEDLIAHQREHSLEVQLPFLQYLAGSKTKIVPILVSQLSREDAEILVDDLGYAIGQAMSDGDAVIIASTDFTHYEPKYVAEEQDRLAIQEIEELDWIGLLDVVYSRDITMCGVIPTATTVRAAAEQGATQAQLLNYYTSGDIIGDASQVVGYGSIKITRGK